jgi:hypothetical protein
VKSTVTDFGVTFTAGVTGVSVRGASESRGDMHDGTTAITKAARSRRTIDERVFCVVCIDIELEAYGNAIGESEFRRREP